MFSSEAGFWWRTNFDFVNKPGRHAPRTGGIRVAWDPVCVIDYKRGSKLSSLTDRGLNEIWHCLNAYYECDC